MLTVDLEAMPHPLNFGACSIHCGLIYEHRDIFAIALTGINVDRIPESSSLNELWNSHFTISPEVRCKKIDMSFVNF